MRTAHTFLSTTGLVTLMLVVTASGAGPNAPEEFAIRKLVAGGSIPQTQDAISWSTAYQRPSIGKERAPEVADEIDTPTRVVVSDSADLAYEYGTFKLSSQRNNGTTGNTDGAYLRVWLKAAGQWKLAAEVRRPYAQ